jgi:hypothetical protein
MASAAAAAASSTARMIRVDALMYLRLSPASLIAVEASSLLSMWLFAFVGASPPCWGRPAGWLALSGVPEPSPSLTDWSTTPSSVRSSPEVSVIV